MKSRQICIVLLLAASLATLFASCGPRTPRVIESPVWQAANTRQFDVTRITLTDTATVVNIDAYANPRYWIRWDTTTYLAGGGKKYMIRSADGIELRAEHYVPESGKDSFVFYFDPIDPGLKTIDLIEGDPADYFKIWGIDLRGGKSVDEIARRIPTEVRSADHSASPLPEPEFKNGMSTLRLKVLGYRPEMDYNPDLSLFSMIPEPRETIVPTEVAPGEWLFEMPVFGPTMARLQLSRMMDILDIMLEPGADNNLWIDLSAWSNKVAPEDEKRQWAWFDGRYAAFNTVYVNEFMPYGDGSPVNRYSVAWKEPMLREMAGMPREELFPRMKALRDEYLAGLDGLDLSPAAKEALRYQIKTDYIENISQLGFQIAYQYAEDNNIEWGPEISERMNPKLTPEDYRVAYEGIDFNDPYLFYGMWYFRAYDDLLYVPEVREVSGVAGTIIDDFLAVKQHLAYPEQTPTFDAASSIPFFADALALRAAYIDSIKAGAATAEGVNVRQVPAEGDTFEKIIAQYKGSPVLVDLWATWCGPCLAAMRDQRSIKEKLIEEGVVFVYITDGSSPKETWEASIPDIKGEHYRVDDDQWREIRSKFNVDGIPFYIMVQRDGTYKADTNMRSLGVWESTIRAAIEKN